jgi:hypothetical protein
MLTHRFQTRCLLAIVLPALAVLVLATVVGAEEYSGPQWFAQAVEPLPIPPQNSQTESTEEEATEISPDDCPPAPQDLPLSELSTDIRPRDLQPQHEVVSEDKLPADCAAAVFTEERFVSIGLSCDSCRPKWCEVFRLAHFCHRPLCFEEACLERCGCKTCCCQTAGSALSFYGRALLIPVNILCVCPCSCVPAHYGCP